MFAAGYVFAVQGPDDGPITRAMQDGLFGTWQSLNAKGRSVTARAPMGVLADYLGMREGEWIFFFRDRALRGAGRLCSLSATGRVPFANWRNAAIARPRRTAHSTYHSLRRPIPWLVPFRPIQGTTRVPVDTDLVLSSEAAADVRTLRQFQGLSFIKLEPRETAVVANAILAANHITNAVSDVTPWHSSATSLNDLDTDWLVDPSLMPGSRQASRSTVGEFLIHCWLVDQLSRWTSAAEVFGPDRWTYVTSQEPASPMKPRIYAELMDIFGFVEVQHAADLPPRIAKYKIIEVKAKRQTGTSAGNVVDQVLRYVDWVANQRAGGDYGAVDAYIVAPSFGDGLRTYARDKAALYYRPRGRQAISRPWDGLHLIEFEANPGSRPSLRVMD